jgi:hypothetical protein
MHEKVIDTLYLYPHHRGWPLKRSLKDIALSELGMRIQDGGKTITYYLVVLQHKHGLKKNTHKKQNKTTTTNITF